MSSEIVAVKRFKFYRLQKIQHFSTFREHTEQIRIGPHSAQVVGKRVWNHLLLKGHRMGKVERLGGRLVIAGY